MNSHGLDIIFPVISTLLPDDFRHCLAGELIEALRRQPQSWQKTPWLIDLGEIEDIVHKLLINPPHASETLALRQIRAGVELLESQWSGLPELLVGETTSPVKKRSLVLIIPQSTGRPPRVITPDNQDLLALKIAAEKLDIRQISRENQVPVAHIKALLDSAARRGLITEPPSTINRPDDFGSEKWRDSGYISSPTFTLQWHITQKCDLHCRHCYDRSSRTDVPLEQGRRILDQLDHFCRKHRVVGQVSFTGGNPLMHPQFQMLYNEACIRGFMTAILGNPLKRQQLELIVDRQMPEFYQLSLEGLAQHNDYIRGAGHFDRVIESLSLLKEYGVFTSVMLTLTRANIDQVLPLAEFLGTKIDLFSFNRLAMVGEGAALASVEVDQYRDFLKRYRVAAAENTALSLKDNLFNLLHLQEELPLTGGCTGYGCGAAFNFISLLADGEVHACRKLPSKIGNIFTTDVELIYHSPEAKKYRAGSSGCKECEIRPVCGGCPAVSHGFGNDIFNDIDPYCFKK
jgi:selenobiotic family peptide radical SAM maturase